MLSIPTFGLSKGHVRLDVLCDWIEGSVLFTDEKLSDTEVFDVLNDEDMFRDQDTAWQAVNDAWAESKRRHDWLGAHSPVRFVGQRIEPLGTWHDTPALSFCLALAFAKWHPDWARAFGPSHIEQGELFEEVTKEAMKMHFPDWEIVPTGWTRTDPTKIAAVVTKVASLLGEVEGNVGRWTVPQANEAGLDLLCYRPFRDGRVGVPVFLMQCGSGGNWDDKLTTPNLRLWGRIVDFVVEPKKAFAMPYALLDDDFIKSCNLVNGLFLDRYRLLSAGFTQSDWISAQLKADIVKWLEPRVAALPRY